MRLSRNKRYGKATVLVALALMMNSGCQAPEQKVSTESPTPDAWEARLEKIQRGEEEFKTEVSSETLDLDKQYEQNQTSLQDHFEECFRDVFSNKTFDAGVPWKSKGQGTRQVLAVTKEKEVQHWSINRSVRKCEKYYSEAFQGIEEVKLVVRVRKVPYMYKFEQGGDLLCKYRKDEISQGGITRHCNVRMPVFIPG